ncbi:MAG: hypothetical protein RIQ60_3692 [Pseudomonadota bacterium]|jgi:ethanolamine ammonia-lyase small subunit
MTADEPEIPATLAPAAAPTAIKAAPAVTTNPWQALRQHTCARIALGRAGVSLPTQPHLAFQLAHAQARDAVHLALDAEALRAALDALAIRHGLPGPALALHSAAADRHIYLQRPDLGRRLDDASREQLRVRLEGRPAGALRADSAADPDATDDPPRAAREFDLALVVADGLSALAVASHAVELLGHLLPALQFSGWTVAPLSVVSQGRVAVADEVGELLRARLAVILIGERPGLSSPDSLGLYLTWMPRPGLTDASRNCISNVRPAGLAPDEAARRLMHLLDQARRRGLSGVALKDDSAPAPARLRTDV